jgi:hypothetical protein
MAKYLRRVPQVPKGGEPIAISSSQRAAIEAAYGRSLSTQIWAKIIVATGLYLEAAPSERIAVPIKEFLPRLNELKELAKSIKNDFAEDVSPNTKSTGHVLTGDKRLNVIKRQYFQRQNWTDFQPLAPYELLEHTLDAVGAVCDFVSMKLSDPEYAGFSEGWLWNYWICWLTMIVKEHGLPYEARNDSDKQKPDSPISPFVLFVDELQKCIPEEFRRHTPPGSERGGPLAKAIERARKETDVDCKFSECIDIPGINELLR